MARWIVDAMNVIGSRPNGWWRDRPGAVRELVRELERLVGDEVVVVVDGLPDPRLGTVLRVEFAPVADDRIVELVTADGDPGSLTVVTSDRVLRERVAARGARVVGPGRLRERLGR